MKGKQHNSGIINDTHYQLLRGAFSYKSTICCSCRPILLDHLIKCLFLSICLTVNKRTWKRLRNREEWWKWFGFFYSTSNYPTATQYVQSSLQSLQCVIIWIETILSKPTWIDNTKTNTEKLQAMQKTQQKTIKTKKQSEWWNERNLKIIFVCSPTKVNINIIIFSIPQTE